jgi:single-strand DNA-binding protein
MLNLTVLRGRLSRPAELRILPTGSTLVGIDITTRRPESEKAVSVPVVWHDAPAAAQALDAGDEVVVVGQVARRFFRAGGATQSRTEVVADAVIPVRSAKRVEAALREAASTLDAALPARSSK